MLRLEPHAGFRCAESRRPDPRHPGVRFVERSYFLTTAAGEEVQLAPAVGAAVATGQRSWPQAMGQAEGRYWWLYQDRVYSTPDRLDHAAVMRLAERARLEAAAAAARQASAERRPRRRTGGASTART